MYQNSLPQKAQFELAECIIYSKFVYSKYRSDGFEKSFNRFALKYNLLNGNHLYEYIKPTVIENLKNMKIVDTTIDAAMGYFVRDKVLYLSID